MAFEWLAQVFWGFFIGGVLVTLIMMVLAGISVSHSADTGTTTDTGADVTADTGADVNSDTGGDVSTDTGVEGASSFDGHDVGSSDTSYEFSSHDIGHDVSGHDMGSSDVSYEFSSHDIGHDASGHDMGHDATGHDMGHDATGHDMSHESGYVYHAHGAGEITHAIDSHIAVNMNVQSSGISADTPLFASDKGQKAPFLLLFAGFLMFAGAFGLAFFGLVDVSIFLVLGIAFLPPILLDKILGLVWRKITKSETYIIPAELPLIGLKVRVVMPVDADGGQVRIDASSSPIGSQRLAVMPLYPQKTFGQGEDVYICDYSLVRGVRFYLVDDDPSEIRRKTHVQV